ncbi:hypothetical protein L916_08865 [Phytophthora nicotianae]|uniref:Uncharacterized protein n=1 Tax=Phytophthora nicotianae TaxID=4792 RepID=W2J2H9_PHYNI|nr:hypothetical protein L916_08865 [Phytophthora nicotianae]
MRRVDNGSAGCTSTSHAGALMAQWMQFLVQQEQVVVPSKLRLPFKRASHTSI